MRIHISRFYEKKRHQRTKICVGLIAFCLSSALVSIGLPSYQSAVLKYDKFPFLYVSLNLFRIAVTANCAAAIDEQVSQICELFPGQQSLSNFTQFVCKTDWQPLKQIISSKSVIDEKPISAAPDTAAGELRDPSAGGAHAGLKPMLAQMEKVLFPEENKSPTSEVSAEKAVDEADRQKVACSSIKKITTASQVMAVCLVAACIQDALAIVFAFLLSRKAKKQYRNGMWALTVSAAATVTAGLVYYLSCGERLATEQLPFFTALITDVTARSSFNYGFYTCVASAFAHLAFGVSCAVIIPEVFCGTQKQQLAHYVHNYDTRGLIDPNDAYFDGFVQSQNSVLEDADMFRQPITVNDAIVRAEIQRLLAGQVMRERGEQED